MSELSILKAKDLTCIRAGRVLFRQLCFELEGGQLLQVTGPNGAGKTSLLKIISGLLTPTAGEVYWCGKELAYLGHQNGVKEGLTPVENLRMALILNREGTTNLAKALIEVGLEGFEGTLCQQLSVGQRQRVALARLLISKALLWILDEPFALLDQQGTFLLEQLLTEHIKRQGLVVITAHRSLNLGKVVVKTLELGANSRCFEGCV